MNSQSKPNLNLIDSDSSRFESDVQPKKKGKSGYNDKTTRTENPRDNQALPKNKLTFEQMLENAMSN